MNALRVSAFFLSSAMLVVGAALCALRFGSVF
jgi:hypothetical protein